MTEPSLSTLRQLEWMTDLQRAANQRATAEESLHRRFESRSKESKTHFENERVRLDTQCAERRARIELEYKTTREEVESSHAAKMAAIQSELDAIECEIDAGYVAATRKADSECKESHWQTMTVFDAEKGRPRARLEQNLKGIAALRATLGALEREVIETMRARRMGRPEIARPADGREIKGIVAQWKDEEAAGLDDPPDDDAESLSSESLLARGHAITDADLPGYVAAEIANVRDAVAALRDARAAKFFTNGALLGVLGAAMAAGVAIAGYFARWDGIAWIGAGAGVGLLVAGGALAWLYPRARRAARSCYELFLECRDAAKMAETNAVREAHYRRNREASEIAARRDAELASANETKAAAVAEADAWTAQERDRAQAAYAKKRQRAEEEYARQTEAMNEKFPRLLTELADRYQTDSDENASQFAARTAEITSERDAEFNATVTHWRQAIERFESAVGESNALCERLFPEWNPRTWKSWTPPTDPPTAIRFGHCELDLSNVRNAISSDARLRPEKTVHALPAMMTLANHPSFVLTTGESGRAAATATMRNLMLRFLTAAPPGKVRFTIFDPLGLGDNFGAFMHLADTDELLVNSRIWTESGHIESRLADLTEHMENVLQKYLRSEFASIHDYNAVAGEVAEPYRVLVIANFPANFTDTAARRLSAILSGGARCGVYTIIHVDQSLRMLTEFSLDDATARAVHLDWDGGKFNWKYGAMERLPLTVEAPPPAEQFRAIVDQVGALAVDANRVEVPFAALAPEEDAIWSESCGRELVVPVGRSGATKWQSVRLGRGTAQHLLIAGKTGSGKSTFLHALIMSAALRYSPDELRFYLVDFKKGVEFKTYATGGLPHADVIAIESEREFGLSVLDRLDQELRRRGDLFRRHGVQDVAAFRAADPTTPLPRMLLLIDEFQELFVEDDKIAQDAALLLDRLVRQGRAFGIHVVLGSQTLAGAYSLARSTLGQMAVRVALQCSDADAHLILSEENSAARLLTRPGEAIYNDQNGTIAGNNPFQVVWFTEPERERYMRALRQRASESAAWSGEQPIVFEGNVPADLAKNPLFAEMASSPQMAPGPARAWLGAAVRIQPPTCVTFRRQGGSNLLIVGQKETLAVGMMSAALVSLSISSPAASSSRAAGAKFFVLDGTRPESPEAGYFEKLAGVGLCDLEVGGVRDAASVLERVAAIVAARSEANDDGAPSVFLFLHNLGRFRDLRRREDDFSFSSFSGDGGDAAKTLSPDKQLMEILREGPAWGVHVLIWADSHNSAQRVFDRAAMREIELRVAMQLSATDSSTLIDTPAASRLGPNRALLHSEDDGTLEKFRPYGPVKLNWLTDLASGWALTKKV